MSRLHVEMLLVFLSLAVAIADEINDFRVQYVRPPYIPNDFNGKALEPLIPGDFLEYYEIWQGPQQVTPAGASIFNLYLMKTKHGHRTYEGVKIATIPDYGVDLRLLTTFYGDYLIMTNGRKLEIYTLWGKEGRREVQVEPNPSFKYQFVYQDWLFVNQTKVLNINEVMRLDASYRLDERRVLRDYSDIPWTVLEQTVLDHISRNCFNYADTITLSSNYATRHYYYVIEDEITGQAFFVPPELETFVRPPNFPYERRYMIIPILNPADRFITTRRHQIFIKNNRRKSNTICDAFPSEIVAPQVKDKPIARVSSKAKTEERPIGKVDEKKLDKADEKKLAKVDEKKVEKADEKKVEKMVEVKPSVQSPVITTAKRLSLEDLRTPRSAPSDFSAAPVVDNNSQHDSVQPETKKPTAQPSPNFFDSPSVKSDEQHSKSSTREVGRKDAQPKAHPPTQDAGPAKSDREKEGKATVKVEIPKAYSPTKDVGTARLPEEEKQPTSNAIASSELQSKASSPTRDVGTARLPDEDKQSPKAHSPTRDVETAKSPNETEQQLGLKQPVKADSPTRDVSTARPADEIVKINQQVSIPKAVSPTRDVGTARLPDEQSQVPKVPPTLLPTVDPEEPQASKLPAKLDDEKPKLEEIPKVEKTVKAEKNAKTEEKPTVAPGEQERKSKSSRSEKRSKKSRSKRNKATSKSTKKVGTDGTSVSSLTTPTTDKSDKSSGSKVESVKSKSSKKSVGKKKKKSRSAEDANADSQLKPSKSQFMGIGYSFTSFRITRIG
ncbi:hypothetical protein M3Y96_01156100 [Aphelenchoides besseyi]|nr:hypothetical protein M3Y96_01156100 [Aphelenchoides besseyi]